MSSRGRVVPVRVDGSDSAAAASSSTSSGSGSASVMPMSHHVAVSSLPASSTSVPASSSSASVSLPDSMPLAALVNPAPAPAVPKAKAMPKGKAKAKAKAAAHGHSTVIQLRGQHMGPLKTVNKHGKIVQLPMHAPIGRLKSSFLESFEKVVAHWKDYRLAQRTHRVANRLPRHTATPASKIEFDQCLENIINKKHQFFSSLGFALHLTFVLLRYMFM